MRRDFFSALKKFIRLEQFSGLLLMGCLAMALFVAHSDFSAAYERWLSDYSLRHWINEGLMTLFFFVVGLEIKRELIGGELSDPRQALFPVLAALGGMLVPALIYGLLNWNSPGRPGWAIPMATDIAFALGVLSLLGQRVPVSLKLFLSALAIVDDIGAILVIALFYSGSLSWLHLSYVLAIALGTAVATSRYKIGNPFFFLLALVLIWISFIPTGIHATLAGILAAMLVPSAADASCDEANESTMKKLEKMLHPLVDFGILPVFVLANAGVRIGGDLGAILQDRVFLGIFAGLFLGKPVGILAFTWLGCRLRWVQKPDNVGWSHIAGVGFIAGIGFTMSLFINGLSFSALPELLEIAKLSVIVSSFAAGIFGMGMLGRKLEK